MANKYFILAILSVSWPTYADVELKFGAGPSISEEQTDQEWFGLVGVEFSNNTYFSLGTNYTYLGTPTGRQNALEVYGRGQYPLVYPLEVYADLGWRDAENKLYAGLGIEYRLSSKWSLELGYRYFDTANTLTNSGLYAMHVGVKFHLNQASPEKKSPKTASQSVTPLIDKTLLSDHDTKRTPEKECKTHIPQTVFYTIIKDDWLLKIARQQNTTLYDILNNNTWLKERPTYVIYPGEVIQISNEVKNSPCQNQTELPSR